MFLFQKTHAENEPDNVQKLVSPKQEPKVDVAALVVITGVLLFIWIVAIIFSGVQCAAVYASVCSTQAIIVYTPLILVAFTFTAFVVVELWRRWYIARKERLANAMYQHFDFTKPNPEMGYLVAQMIAKSLATAQLDTLSQTGNSQGKDDKHTNLIDHDPLRNAKINIEDMFMSDNEKI